jgi:hypothetical protein
MHWLGPPKTLPYLISSASSGLASIKTWLTSLGMKKHTLFDAVADYLTYVCLAHRLCCDSDGFRSLAGRPPLNSSRSPGTQPVDEIDQRGLKHTALWLAQADLASNRIRYVPSRVDLRCL